MFQLVVGGGLAAFLGAALGPSVVVPFRYTGATKSQLAYDFLAAVNGGRFKLHAESADPTANDLRRDLLGQYEAARYAIRANQVMTFFVPERRGHDDLLNATALLAQAQPLGAVRAATGRRRSTREEVASNVKGEVCPPSRSSSGPWTSQFGRPAR